MTTYPNPEPDGETPKPHIESEECHLPSRRERRRIETRERIFEAAMRLVSERDFDAVTVEMITEAADVGKGTFFNYFTSKEGVIAHYFEVLFELISQGFEGQIEQLQAFQALPKHEALDLKEDALWRHVMAMLHRLAEFDSRSHRFARTLLALAQTNEVVRKESLRCKAQIQEIAIEMIRLEQSLGLVRSDYPPDIIARFLRNVYFSTVTEWAQREEGDTQSLLEILDINFHLARDAVRPLDLRHI